MFNSRTCQLILGAGALQLVGLKTITTKNLGKCYEKMLYKNIFFPKTGFNLHVLYFILTVILSQKVFVQNEQIR